ncbi:unnamed protein product [Haemonchus placei]|uniref:E3 UFM1-protein ligase 1 homolog n=1 Tax=Haemonchus placei TaxID=6290 RepID=A0A0N4WDP0_HAEPC|nr:unnamed protein product [Haemonchus placei]
MAATWADIQRLVSDLQRVQLSQSSKKLSEANCVEVVSKLIQRSLIDVVFTRDGHSYITKKHLATEVRNECVALGGRAPLTDIATSLNVDLEHVERIAHQLAAENTEFKISGGELFAEEYVTNLQNELRTLLAEHGYQTLSSLCKHWNLSQELLRSLLLDHLPTDFSGVLEGDTIFTQEYLEAHKNLLRALLSAITKPVAISAIQGRVGLPTNRFWCAFDALLAEGEVPGRLSGSRSSPSCNYVPHIHDQLVRVYVQNTFRQQEFIQTSALKKLGLSEVQIQTLSSILLSKALLQQCFTAVKEAVRESDICEVQSALQSLAIPFDDADLITISEQVASTEGDLHSAGTYVFSDRMLSKAVERLNGRIDAWAHELVRVSVVRIVACTCSETLEEWILGIEVVPEDIVTDVVERVAPQVDDKIRARLTEIAAAQQNAAAQSQKKSLAQLQQKAQGLYSSICMFESASSSFPDSLRDELRQYLLRTMGTDLANAVLSCASGTENAGQLKEKQREDTISSLPTALRDTMNALYTSLRGEDLDAFHSAVFDLSSPTTLSIALKQPDSKTRAEVLESYVAELKEQVMAQTEPAAVLLSCVLYLLAKHGKPVTASGRFVAQLTPQLNGSPLYDLLVSAQRLVVQCLKNKTDEVAKDMLSSEIESLKQMVLS